MKFFCENGQFVELKILGYQYPEMLEDNYDRNWLMIYINVKSTDKQWEAASPALLTFEVQALINWLEKLSDNKVVKYKRKGGYEPNISFELSNKFDSKTKVIKIYFDAEFHPLPQSNRRYCIKLKANNEELKKYVEELKNELEKYPIRDDYMKWEYDD